MKNEICFIENDKQILGVFLRSTNNAFGVQFNYCHVVRTEVMYVGNVFSFAESPC